MCFLVISSILSLKPAVSLAAWWNPSTWFNSWSFEQPVEEVTQTTEVSVQTAVKIPETIPEKQRTPPARKPQTTPATPVSSSNPESSLPPVKTKTSAQTNAAPVQTPLNQIRSAINPGATAKPLVVSLSAKGGTPGTLISIYGSNFITTGQNYISLSNTTRDTGVIAQTLLSRNKVTFTVADTRDIPAGIYDLAVENSSGVRSNTIKFTIQEPKVMCPNGYTCSPGETDRQQVAGCPAGFICIVDPEKPRYADPNAVCPNGYNCYVGETDAVQPSSCATGWICVKAPTIEVIAPDYCPPGYNCNPTVPPTQPQNSVTLILPPQATIDSRDPYTFMLYAPSDATDAIVTVTCPSLVGGASCNTGGLHVLGQNTWQLSILYNLNTTSQPVTVTYTVVSPQGNSSAQTQVTVLPIKR